MKLKISMLYFIKPTSTPILPEVRPTLQENVQPFKKQSVKKVVKLNVKLVNTLKQILTQ